MRFLLKPFMPGISSALTFFLTAILGFGSLASVNGASSSSSSALTLGSSLSHNQTIRSADGLFQFGFFSIPSGSSSMYLGVYYTSLTPLTSVWVANRDKAVSQAATCSFTADGRVNLTDNGEVVWSIGGSHVNASSLVVMNTSNLVLQDANLGVIWQSFDYPGNSWLPGMTLGPGQKLQGWLTENDPTGGSYALIMGDNSNFISVYNGTTQYWDSGPWDGQKFSYVPEMTESYIYTFTFNQSTGFTYYVKANVSENFNISKFVMSSNGLIIESSYDPSQGKWNDFWNEPVDQCNVVRLCGQNSICNSQTSPTCTCPSEGFQPVNADEWNQQVYFHGCERKSSLNCSSNGGSDDGFLAINQTTFVWNFTTSVAMVDVQSCKSVCLANCSCNGFYFNGDGAGNCSLFTENLYDGSVASSALGTFYFRVAAKDLASTSNPDGKSGTSVGLIAGVTVAAVVFLVVVVLAVILIIKKRKLAAAAKTPEAGLRAFSYSELQAATKNFKEKLGSGGFGSVFKGTVVMGKDSGAASLVVAVKKLHRLDEGEKQFRAEVRTIGTIQHVNLVRLMGFCSEGKHRLLVYEMAENGSLDKVLFQDDERAAALTWEVRYNVTLGAARGIAYLHESCRELIIHCDIKPENILLDASYNVKVSDFGLSKLMGREFSHVLTTLRGTRGYLAPEWIAGMPITAKADVYSFGMTVLELLSGRRNINNSAPNDMAGPDFFPVWAAQLIHQPNADLTYLLDPRMRGNVDIEQVRRVAYCAIWCIQDNEQSRPAMGKIVQMLEGTLPVDVPPVPTSLQSLLEADSFTTSRTTSTAFSHNVSV